MPSRVRELQLSSAPIVLVIARFARACDMLGLGKMVRITRQLRRCRESNVNIRPATQSDEATVLALVPQLRSFEPATFRSADALDAGECRTLRRFFADRPAGTQLWVAEANGHVIGAAYVETATDYFTAECHGHLGILVVAKDAQGLGAGQSLMATVEDWARKQGFRFISLNVFADNDRAISFYEKRAYRPDSVRYVKQLR
jgi:GNAT superfamily N-acetyltransferase